MLKNPYPEGRAYLITARVSSEDLAYLRGKFPFRHNISDIVVSNLFKGFINELNSNYRKPY